MFLFLQYCTILYGRIDIIIDRSSNMYSTYIHTYVELGADRSDCLLACLIDSCHCDAATDAEVRQTRRWIVLFFKDAQLGGGMEGFVVLLNGWIIRKGPVGGRRRRRTRTGTRTATSRKYTSVGMNVGSWI